MNVLLLIYLGLIAIAVQANGFYQRYSVGGLGGLNGLGYGGVGGPIGSLGGFNDLGRMGGLGYGGLAGLNPQGGLPQRVVAAPGYIG
ncbi:hypothetical protein evm_010684 [Chilo suppressalis]|nr:hypothetical protein evm_010684 [Chilo suppressalis]